MNHHQPTIEAEPWHFPEESFALIDETTARIHPDDDALVDWFPRYCREHRRRFAADLRILRRHTQPGARILECGAVPLVMTTALSTLSYSVQGVDHRPERFAGAIEELGLDITRCDIEREALPFEANHFDAVLFNELFEHLRIDPIFTLGEVHRVLRPGAPLLLSTPNLRSLRGLRNLLFHHRGHTATDGMYEQYQKLTTLGHMGHVREYTAREVCDFLSRIGFRAERLLFRGGHGRGAVGLVERLLPSLRPFFTVVANKEAP